MARFLIHFRHEGLASARIAAAQRRSGAVLRRHQGDVQHVAAAEHRADGQARVGFLQQIAIGGGDFQPAAHRAFAVQGDHGGHQLGERGDRQHAVRLLLIERLSGALIDDQHRFGVQHQRRRSGMHGRQNEQQAEQEGGAEAPGGQTEKSVR